MKGLIIVDFNRTLYDPDSNSLFAGVQEFLADYSQQYILALIGKGDDKRAHLIDELNIKKYFIINLAGIAALTAFYAVGIRLFGIAADLIPAFHKNAKLSFAAGAIVILLVHIAVSIYLKRKSFYLE